MSDEKMPDWVVVGGPAYLLNAGGWKSRITPATITKITARDVVVTTNHGGRERRYRKGWLTRPFMGGGDLYFDHAPGKYHDPALIGPNNPRIAEIEAADRVDSALSAARSAVDDWQRNRSDVAKGRAAAAALTAWADLAEVEDS